MFGLPVFKVTFLLTIGSIDVPYLQAKMSQYIYCVNCTGNGRLALLGEIETHEGKCTLFCSLEDIQYIIIFFGGEEEK